MLIFFLIFILSNFCPIDNNLLINNYIYSLNCFFKNFISLNKGGVFFIETSNNIFICKLSYFYYCSSYYAGGAIFYSCPINGSLILSKNCIYSCNYTG